MHFETLPPHRHISSKPISRANASKLLEKYLANSEAHPHLHPDALITPTGVTFSSHGGPIGGVVMHNLRRVAAGLRGEYLEPEATPEPEEQDGGAAYQKGRKGKRKAADADVTGGAQEEWQNMSEFEREEGQVEVGEVGDRTNVVQEGGEVPEIEVAAGAEESAKKRKPDEGKVDKEARKKAKKERNKQLKKQKEKTKERKSK
ncbi:hypothetical protein CC80DRAFT_225871 [Byssothecium circinans]|uniref:Uncharacterized protein n=1 Tax=Byssothecium circinans TaxID=147558 RepID=A0A6A5TES8_9PLEO|nr:hypothetical protein CC80DRAFT_225871 [Byssothecium circinans]